MPSTESSVRLERKWSKSRSTDSETRKYKSVTPEHDVHAYVIQYCTISGHLENANRTVWNLDSSTEERGQVHRASGM
jgi:hypothetical protein